MRSDEAGLLVSQSGAVANGPGQDETIEAAFEEALQSAWTNLLASTAVLQARLDAGTLLPGTCRDVEMSFYAHVHSAMLVAQGRPAPGAADLGAWSWLVGYDTALNVAVTALQLLASPLSWPASEAARVQAFVLAALGTIQATGGVRFRPGAELGLVSFVERTMGAPGTLDLAFHASVVARWCSAPVASVLFARGSLQTGVSSALAVAAEHGARQRADVLSRGFRACGLAACGLREVSVRQFKVCGGCSAVAYCGEEHASAHWTDGHRRECRHLRAAGAKPPSTADAA